MPQNRRDEQAKRQLLRIGVSFLMAGLGALVLFGELTPLLVLGVVFTFAPAFAPGNPLEVAYD